MLLLGMPKKYQPDFPFLRAIPTSRVNPILSSFAGEYRILLAQMGWYIESSLGMETHETCYWICMTHTTGWFFWLFLPNFSTKKKIANQPIIAAVPVSLVNKKKIHLGGTLLENVPVGGGQYHRFLGLDHRLVVQVLVVPIEPLLKERIIIVLLLIIIIIDIIVAIIMMMSVVTLRGRAK